MEYEKTILEELQNVLKEIFAEIIRVCDGNGIEYFIQGGTAMGAFFFNDILPWDDDMDIGMTMENYKKFIDIAPQKLRKGFSLQVFDTEPETPFYFAKVRKDNTLFLETLYKDLNIHHGIYVDIFPYNKIPDCRPVATLQRTKVRFLINCFISKSIWIWKKMSGNKNGELLDKSYMSCLAIKFYSAFFSKKELYKQLMRTLCRYDKHNYRYYNIVRMPKDMISVQDVEHLVKVHFGGMKVNCPDNVETYLRNHYGNNIEKYPPAHIRVNHAPMKLSFNTKENKII